MHLESKEITTNKLGKHEEIMCFRLVLHGETEILEKAICYCGIDALDITITNERLVRRGYYDISEAYKSLCGL